MRETEKDDYGTTDEAQEGVMSHALRVGDQVRLDWSDPRWWWVVQAVTEHFAVCVHQVPFKPAGTLCYTVLDWRNGVRGPCNLIGQGWGDGSYSEQECAEMLSHFEAHEPFMQSLAALPPGEILPSELTLEVSHRNRVPLKVLETRPASHSAGAVA